MAKELTTEPEEHLVDCEEQDFNSLSSSASVKDNSFDASEEESEVDVFNAGSSKKCNSRGGIRRMPQRSAKSDPMRFKQRTLMKPSKTSPKTTEKLRPAEIKRLYTNKKLTNFRPTSLETIFEEPQPVRGNEDAEQFRFIGSKKLRRTLVCSDGISTNKAIINRRRARIKSKLGRRFTWKKMPLQNFLNHMQSSDINSKIKVDDKDKLGQIRTPLTLLKTVNDSDDFVMDATNEQVVCHTKRALVKLNE